MPTAWSCSTYPDTHGAFRQLELDEFQAKTPWARRGFDVLAGTETKTVFTRIERFACPACTADGKPGFMRPSTHGEILELDRRAA